MNHCGIRDFVWNLTVQFFYFQRSEEPCVVQPGFKYLSLDLDQDFTLGLLCLHSAWLLLASTSTQIANIVLLMLLV